MCLPGCLDKFSYCYRYSRYCRYRRYAYYMKKNCPVTCNYCSSSGTRNRSSNKSAKIMVSFSQPYLSPTLFSCPHLVLHLQHHLQTQHSITQTFRPTRPRHFHAPSHTSQSFSVSLPIASALPRHITWGSKLNKNKLVHSKSTH